MSYRLTWLYTDIDGRKQRREKDLCQGDDYWASPWEAYDRKVTMAGLLVGGATSTDIKLYKVQEVLTEVTRDATPHTESGPDCWCGDLTSHHFISKGRVDRT